jgi:hypothetical protein
MQKLAAITIFLLTFFFDSYGQSASVKGTLIDSNDHGSLLNTAVSLMRKSDSVLVKFTRADKNGKFSLANLNQGSYIMMMTHPYFGDYVDTVKLGNDQQLDIGKVFMLPKSKLLAEVIIKSGSPIRIKGDTTVYTADSFKVREGANVEELLRRLPGIQVDKNGQITAMGEKVTKVLVDGEEFFGDDPGIATKNLRADAVKEVEVFDKKSDQATFTGIDDGVKDKTINLKLKDNAKHGYFGKVEAGGGLKDKYNNDAMLNAFKGKRKIAAYGIMSNTGQTNLDWNDSRNYGGDDGVQMGMTDDGGMYISVNGNGDDNYYGGSNGIPKNWNGGLHYSNKFDEDKQSLNAGYKYSKVIAPLSSRMYSNTFLPDTSWNTNSTTNTFNSKVKHAFNLTYEVKIDSMNSLKLTSRFNNNTGTTQTSYYTESKNLQDQFLNNNTSNTSNNSDNNAVTSTLLWQHKFKKISRTLSINTDFNWSQSKNNGFQYQLLNLYNGGAIASRDTTDQENIRNSSGTGVTTKLAYTEPLMKDTYLEFSYGLSYNNNFNARTAMSKGFNDKYENIIDSLTNSFTFNRVVNTPGLNFRMNKKKASYSIGTSVGFNSFIQKNNSDGSKSNYNFVNVFPQASFTYKMKSNSSLRFNYNGSGTAPSLQQLQPVKDNSNNLYVYIGNPNLKQSFQHRFNSSYNFYNVLKERGMWLSLSYSFWQHAFSQSSTLSNDGKGSYQTVNVDGNYNLNFYSNYNFKIKDTKWRLGFGPTASYRQTADYINTVKNINKNRSAGIEINGGQYVPDKYNFNFGPNFSFVKSSSSVNSSANANYWQIEGWASGNFTLKKGFEVGTDVNIEARQKDPRFSNQNNNYILWNASATKRFAKDLFELKFSVNDILDQNRGYQRSFSSYSFSESYYTTLRRFWLVTFTWNISKNGKPAKDW